VMVDMTLNSHNKQPQKELPQYIEVQVKVASTGCIFSLVPASFSH
jgi:hypothetical protein